MHIHHDTLRPSSYGPGFGCLDGYGLGLGNGAGCSETNGGYIEPSAENFGFGYGDAQNGGFGFGYSDKGLYPDQRHQGKILGMVQGHTIYLCHCDVVSIGCVTLHIADWHREWVLIAYRHGVAHEEAKFVLGQITAAIAEQPTQS